MWIHFSAYGHYIGHRKKRAARSVVVLSAELPDKALRTLRSISVKGKARKSSLQSPRYSFCRSLFIREPDARR